MYVSNGDARIAVHLVGDGADTIVLIHGFPLSLEIWMEQIPALAQRMRVAAIDLRGMGRSSVPDGPYLMESLAGDVAAVLDALGAERAAIVGHSLGGYVALAFARMYVERLARLTLVCSRIAADTPQRAAHRYELADAAERTNSNAQIVREMCDATLGATTRRERPEIIEKFEEIARKNDPRGLAAMLRGMAMRDGAEDIANDVKVPVLIVHADEDPLGSIEDAGRTAAAFPAGRLTVIERSGHVPMLEAPGALTGCLVDFNGS
jgi:3-oxoadipate enol-lactonase